MIAILRRVTRSRKGSMPVEFALVLPIFLFLLLGIANFSMLFLAKLKLANGVSAGAQYAVSYYSQNVSALNTAITGPVLLALFPTNVQFVVQGSANFSASNPAAAIAIYNNSNNNPAATTTPSSVCYCPTGSAPPWNFGSPVNCGTSCGSTNVTTAGKYLSIVATYTFTPIIANPWVGSQTLTDYALVRLQ